MEFSDDQQAAIDKMISKRIAEVKSKHETALAEALAEAEAKAQSELEALRAENTTLKSEQGQSSERIRKALLKAEVSQASAYKPDQVLRLIDDAVALREGELAVIDSEGNVRLDEAGRPYSVKSFVEGFLMDNPHLAKTSGTPGAGSISAIGTTGTGATSMRRSAFDALDPARKSDFLSSGGTLAD